MRAPLFAVLPLTFATSLAQAQTLPEAMQHALEVHPEVQAGVNARLSADYAVRAAQAGYLPKVDVLAGYGRENTDSPTTRAAGTDSTTLNRGEASVRLSQMIFDGFSTQNEVGRQQATANSRAYSLLGTSQSTALKVAQVYLDVLARREYVRLADENLKNHQRILDQIKLRTSRGVGRNADLDQAEGRVANAENNLFTEQTNLNDAITNYISAVGQAPDELVAPSAAPALFPANLDEARAQMVSNSPVLRSAESDIAATEKQYTAARSSFYPRFDATLEKDANNNISGEEGHYNGWAAMVRMQFNLYNGGASKADMQSKAYASNQALDIRNNALRQLNEELGLAWNALQNARQQLPVAEQYAARIERVRTAYQSQFSLGERTLLDLLDSENENFTAHRRVVEVNYNEQLSRYRIQAASGGLLKSQGVVAPLASVVQSDIKPEVKLPGMN